MIATCHSKSNNNYSIVSTVQIGDITLVVLTVLSMFSYGTVWNGFSAGQITLFRLAGSLFMRCIFLYKACLPPLGKRVLLFKDCLLFLYVTFRLTLRLNIAFGHLIIFCFIFSAQRFA